MKTVAVIVAAGRGIRMGGQSRKQFLLIDGRPVLAHTLDSFEACRKVDEVVVVAPKEEEDFVSSEVVKRFGFQKVCRIVSGGAHRQDSVYRGLKAVHQECHIVVIHDGVRPLVTPELIGCTIDHCVEHGAVIVAVRPRDTVKEGNGSHVLKTLERDTIWTVQTPQTFRHDLLLRAYRAAFEDGFYGTDDASLVERLGAEVRVLEGSHENIKITNPLDLLVAEAILKHRRGE